MVDHIMMSVTYIKLTLYNMSIIMPMGKAQSVIYVKSILYSSDCSIDLISQFQIEI